MAIKIIILTLALKKIGEVSFHVLVPEVNAVFPEGGLARIFPSLASLRNPVFITLLIPVAKNTG